MGVMDANWTALGDAIKKRRKALRFSQDGLAHAANVSRSTIQKLEWGTAQGISQKNLGQVERALGWAPGSADAVLNGGQPTLIDNLAPDESYRREPMSDDDLVAVVHHVVYDLMGHTSPDTSLAELKELEARALRVALSVGRPGPRRRTPTNVEDDPEP